jgi:uncharacterized iron-regulated protein
VSTRALAALLALTAACAPRFDPRLVDVPIAGRRWVSTEGVDHPLVGKIWEPKAARFVDEATLRAAVASADFVALGEIHDNPDHHLLQARLVRAMTAAGRRPALAFEMLDTDQQPKVDASVAAAPRDPDALGKAVDWAHSGWPEFRYYRPVFEAGLDAGLPIVAANLPRAKTKELRTKGREALDDGLRTRLERDEPIPKETVASMRAEMEEAHCGEMPDAWVDPMILVQRSKDARMAERMTTAGAERGAVLISGKGHARTDRGVPAIVAKDVPGKKVVVVAFTEVEKDQQDPAAYHEDEDAAGPAPFDFLVFTPRTERGDPCEGMKQHMEKKRAEAAKDGAKEAAPATPAAPAAPPAEAPAKP